MGTVESTFKVGDTVTIKERNIDVLEREQRDHGEWASDMEECFDRPCTVQQAFKDNVIIVAPSGRVYRVNESILTKMVLFKVGDKVEVRKDIMEVKKLQKGFGEWVDGMEIILDKVVEVVAIKSNGICVVQCGDDKWTVNSQILSAVCETQPSVSTTEIAPGRKARIIKDKANMISLQEGHGGWSDLMTLILDREVEILETCDDGDCVVTAFGMKWLINSKCIEGQSDVNKRKFKRRDRVRICDDIERVKILQENNGGWVSSMRNHLGKQGVVSNVFPNGLIEVTSKGSIFVYNPLLLTLDESGKNEPSFEVGDIVKVNENKEDVKRKQAGHGEWVESMSLILGMKGKIKHIYPDGDLRVKVMGMTLTFNPNCVTPCDGESDNDEIPDLLKMFADIKKVLEADSDEETKPKSDTEDKKRKLHVAIKKGSIEEVKGLVELYGVNETIVDCTALHLAAFEGQIEIVKMLLNKNAVIDIKDSNGNAPLHLAVKQSHIDVCHILIGKGADINVRNKTDMTPLMLATIENKLDIMKFLLSQKNIDIDAVDDSNDTALHIAVVKSNVETLEVLLNAGADMSIVNKKGINAFHLAAMKGDTKVVKKFLTTFGLSLVDSRKDDGFAAIHLAAINNNVACLKLLIESGADLNIRNNSKQTALHVAVTQKYIDCIKVLVASKANLNLKDDDGDTALHVAVKIHNMRKLKKMKTSLDILKRVLSDDSDNSKIDDVIVYLVESGANLDIRNNAGKTVIDICMSDVIKAKILSLQENKDRFPQPANERQRDASCHLEELLKKVEKLEDEKTCSICRDRQFNVTFQCGHLACDKCANNLHDCHICRERITNVIRLYNC